MSRFKTIPAVLLLMLWLPATSYCLIENIEQPPGCCHQGEGAPVKSGPDCKMGCGIVDAVGIHLKWPAPTGPLWNGETFAAVRPGEPQAAPSARRLRPGDSPPNIQRLAVLRARTSLPVRGPSSGA